MMLIEPLAQGVLPLLSPTVASVGNLGISSGLSSEETSDDI